jgi:hypothetical protein
MSRPPAEDPVVLLIQKVASRRLFAAVRAV